MSELGSRIPTYEQFLEYRAVVIQAIAAAWHDPAFLEYLKDSPKQAMFDRFGYKYPFSLDLKVRTGSAAWTPARTGGWTTQQNDTLQLVLPPAPAQQEQRAAALAAYNTEHIHILD
jgi:ribosomally synthesized peptide (two-chain TOMM family)